MKEEDVRRIRIMIVDDHAIVREGLRTVVESQRDMQVVAEAAGSEDVVALFAGTQPDVVIVDLRLRNGSGVEAIRALRSIYPGSRIVVLSNYSSEEHVFRAIAAGAHGYVVKDEDPSHILAALRAVREGRRYLSPEASASLADHVDRSSLTPREEEVLTLLARGERNRAIADVLGISEETVKGHVKNILGKLGVRDRAHATSEAIRLGLVDV
jgi:two-component system NarL family response regulator